MARFVAGYGREYRYQVSIVASGEELVMATFRSEKKAEKYAKRIADVTKDRVRVVDVALYPYEPDDLPFWTIR